ncbi:aspartyl protease family protein [Bacteroidales bacterium OttesenSCG-928-K03]|nr:aspartyl protease family protein [Bacteroidales bacterium OttesenSCG-928-L14]MDL2242304.1 aspartyl protease family protein [Bacteroidales bacterium OttesenSCG-928-K03]
MKKNIILIITILLVFQSCSNKKNEVKFEKDGYFYIYATINNSITGRFILDTGASGLYLDSTFVKKHSSIIKSSLDTARMRGAGATGYKQVLLIKDSIKINVGDYSHNFINSPILKLTDINGENIAGIIGNDFIENKVLIINNKNLTLKIDTTVNLRNYETILPFTYVGGRIYLSADITMNENKIVTPKLLIDLGCPDAIILNSTYFKSLTTNNILPENIIDYTILFGGALGGNSEGGEFRVKSIKLGNDIIENPIISFSKDTLGAFSRIDYDGLLGNKILDRYNYAIDYSAQKLYLAKNSNSKQLLTSSLTGFYAIKIDSLATVISIYYQSEAYKNGIRLGDTIISINNKNVKNLTEKEFYNEMKEEGKQIKVIVLRDEKPFEILFKLKYMI